MKARSLYPLVFLWVLLLAGCEPNNATTDPSNPQSVSDTARGDAPVPELEITPSATPTILVLGNSLAAGYGLHPDQSFPALLQQKIDSLGWNFEVVNAGLSGETTAAGLRRIDWLLRRPVDVLILELGGNDGLRGISPDVTEANLNAIIDKTRARYPDVRIILAGMQIPPNLGQDYTRRFRELYPRIAEEKHVELIPFLLEGVGGVASLMQADGIHPTARGQEIVAENVWKVLQPILLDLLASAS